jgi:hypothetical protein
MVQTRSTVTDTVDRIQTPLPIAISGDFVNSEATLRSKCYINICRLQYIFWLLFRLQRLVETG